MEVRHADEYNELQSSFEDEVTKRERAEAERDAALKDAARFVFSKSPEHAKEMSEIVLRYVATQEEWTIDDWRREIDAAIDAARKEPQ